MLDPLRLPLGYPPERTGARGGQHITARTRTLRAQLWRSTGTITVGFISDWRRSEYYYPGNPINCLPGSGLRTLTTRSSRSDREIIISRDRLSDTALRLVRAAIKEMLVGALNRSETDLAILCFVRPRICRGCRAVGELFCNQFAHLRGRAMMDGGLMG
ncbi:hypothetical protein Mp_8g11190 [Marchantia polymorpha subsp. ruderalis]|uniref:Uncharacterized protein n=1 Tax=Marchantia polymorpha TaxID=3197 RepID=A0A2R6XMJ1_MARPO|nr:hypothetical protein MARPO_0008s0102 [Marchantia polymorpha]BBN19498.1 hypothetical protein Mp_8g11190 [Marchantia polymorpha subsp. ruderalis]|eukprot:PTQ47331.1 hypothetical protein MARPO_0008s0102 [Marchantia polymorpha]